jgi:protease-4
MGLFKSLLRTTLFLLLVAVAVAAGWIVLLEYPTDFTDLLGVLVLILAVPAVAKVAGSIVSSLVPGYNVAEVTVSGPIRRGEGGSPLSAGPGGAQADRIVEQIDRADENSSVDALLVKLNTPGGEIVPSEDIKLAAERFEGPTIAYTTDTCASGGYEIASGCDELWAREGSIVGSIGVIGSRVNAAELADRIGLEYEQLTAGEYKDAGTPLKELEDHEREYLQGIIDEYYDQFVEGVAERRDLDPESVRDTEARVFLGTQAIERGLVDELGTRADVVEALEDRLDTPVAVKEFQPQFPLSQRLGAGAQRLAFSFGAGIAATIRDDDRPLRLR